MLQGPYQARREDFLRGTMEPEFIAGENKVTLWMARIGVFAMVLAFLLNMFALVGPAWTSRLCLARMLFSGAYLIWAWISTHLQNWEKPAFALFFLCLIYIVDIVSEGLARHHVVMAFGFPSSDYPYTCSIIKSIYLAIIVIIASTLPHIISNLAAFLRFNFRDNSLHTIIRNVFGVHYIRQFSSAITLLSFWWIVPIFELNYLQRESIIFLGYFSDYESAYRYPGLNPNERIKLHANGVVSFLTSQGGSFQVNVLKDDEFKLRALAK